MHIKLGKTPLREAAPRNSALREVVDRLQCHHLLRMILAQNGRPPSGARLIVLASCGNGLDYHVVYCYDINRQSHLDWACDVATNYPEYWDAEAEQSLKPFESCLS